MEDVQAQCSAEMPRYQSHKTVWALKIGGVTFPEQDAVRLSFVNPAFAPKTVSIKDRPKPGAGWYYVVYSDGYHSFSPAEQFEKGNTLIEKLPSLCTFGWALKQIQNGARVCREGWNGKGMFIFLVPGSTFQVNRKPLLGIYPEGTRIDYWPHIDMKTADGQIVPWVASQTDLLACDWEIAAE